MKWFRRHIKTGSRLALFAFAIQLALSFGHFHFDAARAAPEVQLHVNLADAHDRAVEAASHARHQDDSHDPDHHPATNCAVCVVLSMAQQALFATPTVLLLPDAYRFLHLATEAEFVHLGSGRSAFQSRAPPVS